MLVEIQFDNSSFELRSNAVQSFLNVPIAQSVSRITKGFLASDGSFELYINVI